MSNLRAAVALPLAAALAACGGSETTSPAARTFASGAACDPTLSYANFGQAFLGTYCTACHRPGGLVPNPNLDWTNPDQVRASRFDIDAAAGSGPNGTFTAMPDPSFGATVFPPVGERARLSGWLACDAP